MDKGQNITFKVVSIWISLDSDLSKKPSNFKGSNRMNVSAAEYFNCYWGRLAYTTVVGMSGKYYVYVCKI